MLRPEMRLSRPIRIILIALAVILGMLTLLRAASEEGRWAKSSKGKWIKRSNLSTPKPSEVRKRK